jgi:hypothetical protein
MIDKSKVQSLAYAEAQDTGAQSQPWVDCEVGMTVMDCEVLTERLHYQLASGNRNFITT